MNISPERVPEGRAEGVLEHVLHFRKSYDRYAKPDDVNALLGFFPRVHVRSGYQLDYDWVHHGDTIKRIRPYARPLDGQAPLLADPSTEGEERSDQAVETLYQYLHYDPTPEGLFEYAFFVQELWATRASWHDAEWLATVPIFTRARFEGVLQTAQKVVDLHEPESCAAEAMRTEAGGRVRFLVHTPMGWDRIYWLEIDVEGDGRLDVHAGDIVADFGLGETF